MSPNAIDQVLKFQMLCFRVDGPYLYKVSYLLYVVIGCSVTILVGWAVSLLASYWGYQPPQPPSPDLFTPPVANYLRRKQQTCNDMVSIAVESKIYILNMCV